MGSKKGKKKPDQSAGKTPRRAAKKAAARAPRMESAAEAGGKVVQEPHQVAEAGPPAALADSPPVQTEQPVEPAVEISAPAEIEPASSEVPPPPQAEIGELPEAEPIEEPSDDVAVVHDTGPDEVSSVEDLHHVGPEPVIAAEEPVEQERTADDLDDNFLEEEPVAEVPATETFLPSPRPLRVIEEEEEEAPVAKLTAAEWHEDDEEDDDRLDDAFLEEEEQAAADHQTAAAEFVPKPRAQDGLKVRVIGTPAERRPARTASEPSPRKGLEIGMKIGGGKASTAVPYAKAPADTEEEAYSYEEEEIVRLVNPLEDEPRPAIRTMDSPELAPAETGGKKVKQGKGLSLTQWTLIMAAGTVAGIVGIIALTRVLSHSSAPQAQANHFFELEIAPLDESETSKLVRDVGDLAPQAEKILEDYAAAKTPEEALKYVRDPERVKPLLVKQWKPWPKPAFSAANRYESLVAEGQGRPALGIGGTRGDFEKFFMLFVRIDDRLLLDWEASFGISEIPIPAMAEKAGKDPVDLRGILKRDAFFTEAFPESQYRAYEILAPDKETYVWGYVPVNSPAGDAVARAMNEDSYVLDAHAETAVTVRVQRKEGGLPNQFLILELLHKGWVSP